MIEQFAIDVDGVISNFSQGFIERAEYLGYKNFPVDWTVIPAWDFGVDPKIWGDVWNDIQDDPKFWMDLDVMQRISFTPLAYITIRPIDYVTEAWLFRFGFPTAPVITLRHGEAKSKALKQIGAKFYIDDYLKNYEEITNAGIQCFLQDRPWNREFNAGSDRVLSVADAVKVLDTNGLNKIE